MQPYQICKKTAFDASQKPPIFNGVFLLKTHNNLCKISFFRNELISYP